MNDLIFNQARNHITVLGGKKKVIKTKLFNNVQKFMNSKTNFKISV